MNFGNSMIARAESRTEIEEVNLNRAFDAALPNIRRYISRNGWDPMEAPDIEIPLSHLVIILSFFIEIYFEYIQMKNKNKKYHSSKYIFRIAPFQPGLLKTKMQLHHGHVQQLSTLFRTGDITLQYSKEKISVYLNIGWETLDASIPFIKLQSLKEKKKKNFNFDKKTFQTSFSCRRTIKYLLIFPTICLRT